MEPKYKVGDTLKFYGYDNMIHTMPVDFIKYSKAGEPIYCRGTERVHSVLQESAVIGVIPRDEEEYQLYLKLKEKYE